MWFEAREKAARHWIRGGAWGWKLAEERKGAVECAGADASPFISPSPVNQPPPPASFPRTPELSSGQGGGGAGCQVAGLATIDPDSPMQACQDSGWDFGRFATGHGACYTIHVQKVERYLRLAEMARDSTSQPVCSRLWPGATRDPLGGRLPHVALHLLVVAGNA